MLTLRHTAFACMDKDVLYYLFGKILYSQTAKTVSNVTSESAQAQHSHPRTTIQTRPTRDSRDEYGITRDSPELFQRFRTGGPSRGVTMHAVSIFADTQRISVTSDLISSGFRCLFSHKAHSCIGKTTYVMGD